ncbi:hypothetical protein EI74_0191 [Mycoplasma testudineum]|uniref:Cell division protein FtsA n=1 Tax=Mycoplasma testudineum TaxID=244584 RepID=A0A4R6IFN1_9MOLU|nr:hypothetical protein [Mycoplasma testudineum]OYD27087.1 hypothetical protein CG473_00330 [Mycoplasma testudineum]TDO21160.1 hypothetical protein EI74_0191 [Mycoplasma testudineum]
MGLPKYQTLVEIDIATYRFVTYVNFDNVDSIVLEKEYYVDKDDVESSLQAARTYLVNYYEKIGTRLEKIDIVYKTDFLKTTLNDFSVTKTLNENYNSKKKIISLIKNIASQYEKVNQNHYIIDVVPLHFNELNVYDETINIYESIDEINFDNQKFEIHAKITCAEKSIVNNLKEKFKLLGLKINKIYPYAKLVNDAFVNKDLKEDFINIHFGRNKTYISKREDGNVTIIKYLDFGENSFIKHTMNEFDFDYDTAKKYHFLFSHFLETAIERKDEINYFSPLLSVKDFINNYTKLITSFWEKTSESIKDINGNKIKLFFSGNISFMGKTLEIASKIFDDREVELQTNYRTPGLDEIKFYSVWALSRISNTSKSSLDTSTFTMPLQYLINQNYSKRKTTFL